MRAETARRVVSVGDFAPLLEALEVEADDLSLAHASSLRSVFTTTHGSATDTFEHIEGARELFRKSGAHLPMMLLGINAAFASVFAHQLERARVLATEALHACRSAGHGRGEAFALTALAFVELNEQNLVPARDHFRTAVDVPAHDGRVSDDAGADAGACSECEDGFICNSMTGACTAIETPCQIADCQANQATSCDGVFSLRCDTVGGECVNFTDASDVSFQWCSCGDLAEGTGTCTGDNAGIDCDGGVAVPFTCPVGSLCLDAGSEGTLCICDDDGICPDVGCVDDPDCGGCVPSCGSRACGANGCGGDCGGCGLGLVCTDVGTCQGCTPSCDGRSCGADRCGGVCGRCGGDESCDDEGQCRSDCMPSCAGGQMCGSDGCGGVCGTCPAGEVCSASDACERSCFFENTTYTFDASALDWSNTNYVALRVRQLRGDGSYTGCNTQRSRGARRRAQRSRLRVRALQTLKLREATPCVAPFTVMKGRRP